MSLRLGHIVYSNCFPVHARLLDRPRDGDPQMVKGVPSRLNALLAAGEIDVAPCSSIEYARHAGRYRILPDLVIGSRGAVRSILFLSRSDPKKLSDRSVALPNASATSTVLLKILLHRRWKVQPRFRAFDQAATDPFADGADAALFIGDVALRPELHPEVPVRLDLGAEWFAETGLPFAFAVWQASGGDAEAWTRLHGLLLESRAYGSQKRAELAERWSGRFGFAADFLETYRRGLVYEQDQGMIEGLTTFYRYAAEIGEVPAVPEFRWTE